MTGWNYRVIEFARPGVEPWRAIHEVYYDDGGHPYLYAEEPANVIWDVSEGDDAPVAILEYLGAAIRKDVLYELDFSSEASG